MSRRPAAIIGVRRDRDMTLQSFPASPAHLLRSNLSQQKFPVLRGAASSMVDVIRIATRKPSMIRRAFSTGTASKAPGSKCVRLALVVDPAVVPKREGVHSELEGRPECVDLAEFVRD